MQDYQVNSFLLSGIRLAFTFLFTGVILLAKKTDLHISRKQVRDVAIFGIFGETLTLVFYAMATNYISVGLVGMCHYFYPLLVALVSCLLFQEKLTKYKVFASVFMLTGLALTSGGGSVSLTGVLLALTTAVTFGAYVMSLEHSSLQSLSGFKLLFYIALFGGVSLFAGLALCGQLVLPAAPKVYVVQAMGSLVSQIGGMVFLAEGVKRIGATKAAFLSILEPAFTLVWDFVLFHTVLLPITWVGVALMFGSFLIILKEPPKDTTEQIAIE